MSWPLTRPFSEAELYKQRLDDALESASNGFKPIFAMMRHAASIKIKKNECLYQSYSTYIGQFENLFKNLVTLKTGFLRKLL